MRYRPSGQAVVIALWRANIKAPLEVVVDNLETVPELNFQSVSNVLLIPIMQVALKMRIIMSNLLSSLKNFVRKTIESIPKV